MNSLDACVSRFLNIFTILLLPFKNKDFKEAFGNLRSNNINLEEVNVLTATFEDGSKNLLSSIALRSPFRKMFNEIKNSVEYNIEITHSVEQLQVNNYRDTEMCQFIVNKYCAFLPFWTNIMGIFVDPSGKGVSNGPVENSFMVQKHILLQGRNNLRPGEFIRLTRKNNMSTLKEIRYMYQMYNKIKDTDASPTAIADNEIEISTNDHNYSHSSCFEEPEEEWGKKCSKRQKLINPQYMNSMKGFKNEVTSKRSSLTLNENALQAINVDDAQKRYFIFDFQNLYITYGYESRVVPGFYSALELGDFLSLRHNEWLSTFTIDACIVSLINESGQKNIFSIPCQIDKIHSGTLVNIEQVEPVSVIIPIIASNHFILCIANFDEKKFIFLDSLFDNDGKSCFISFLASISEPNDSAWSLEVPKRDVQKDSSSCGVFLLYYVQRFLHNEGYTSLGSINIFRKYLRSLLHQNGSTDSICYKCGTRNLELVKCNSCKYHRCRKCLSEVYSNVNETCSVCQLGIF